MNEVIMMAMQTCQEYASKMSTHSLTEYEMQMYEQMCITVKSFMKLHDKHIQTEINKMESGEGDGVEAP